MPPPPPPRVAFGFPYCHEQAGKVTIRCLQEAYARDMQPFQVQGKKGKSMDHIQKKKKQKLIKRMYRYVYEFCEVTSFHGWKQLAKRGRHWTEYVMWTACVVAAVVMTMYVSSINWARFNHFPTVIVMERNSLEWNITFPTATICPSKKVDETILERLALKYEVENQTAFIEFFAALSLSEFETYNYLPDYDEIPPDQFLNIIIEAAYNFTHEVTSSLTLDSEELDGVYTELGICYSYNSKIAPYFNPPSLIGQAPAAERSQDLYYCNAMDGDAFAGIVKYQVPYNICITGPYEMPIEGTPFQPGGVAGFLDLDVACLPIISAPEVRELEVEQRKCRFRSDGSLRVSDIYSYNLCRMECRLDLAYSLCQCIPYIYVNDAARIKQENKPICDVKGMKCLGKHGRLLSELRDPVTKRKVSCNCYPLCTDFHFRMQSVDDNPWLDARVRWQIKDYPKTRYKRTIIFGFTDLVVSIGATAGLFLGCSLLSFVELGYFFTIRLAFILFKERRVQHTTESMVAFIHQVYPKMNVKDLQIRNFSPHLLHTQREPVYNFYHVQRKGPHYPDKKTWWKSAYNFVYEYLRVSTFHGFRHLTPIGRHWSEYALWSLFLCLAIGGSAYLSSKSWYRYQYLPTVNAIDRDYKKWNTTLPAIVMCPKITLSQWKLDEYLQRFPEENRESTEEFIQELANIQYNTLSKIPKHLTAPIPPDDFMEVLNELHYNLQFQERVDAVTAVTEMGICVVFNSNVSLYQTPELLLAAGLQSPNSTIPLSVGNPLGGDLVSTVLNILGPYWAYYSSPNDIPDARAKRYDGPLSTYRNFQFDGMSTVCSSSVRTLHIAQRRCRFSDESNLAISAAYSYNLCRMDCRRRLALELCKCAPFFYKKVEGDAICDMDGMRCLGENEDLLINLVEVKTATKIECNCLPTCEDQVYYIDNTNNARVFMGTSLKWSLLRFPKMRIRRDLIFGFPELLVSIGGTAGLFLGCSVLSFAEIIYFFTLRLFFYIREGRDARIS